MTAKLGAGYFDEQDTEYIKHLNHIYELGKTKVNVAVSEKMVGQHLLKDNACDKFLRAIFGKWYWRVAETEDEENDDWSHIMTPPYSSGDSDTEINAKLDLNSIKISSPISEQ